MLHPSQVKSCRFLPLGIPHPKISSSHIMDFLEASKQFKIPIKAFYLMQEDGLLSSPLALQEINNLAFLGSIWGKEKYLNLQLAGKSMKRREKIIQKAGLSKTESYILNRYLNSNGKRLSISQLVGELHDFYGVPTAKASKTVYKIRNKAYNIRKQKKVSSA